MIGNTNGRLYPNGRTEAAECRCPACSSVIRPEQLAIIVGAEAARRLEIEQAVEAKFARQLAEVEKKQKREIDAAVKAATAALREGQVGIVAKAVDVEREKSSKAVAEAVAAARVEHATEKARLEAALTALQHRLAARPAHQIGEPAEVDLYETLVAAFPNDRISRVAKGVRGPDVLIEVICEGGVAGTGEVAGKICLDSKAHARWSNRFTRKLADDAAAANCVFSVLSTTTFPAGVEQLHIQDGVLVAAPQRVVVLVHLLRKQIIDSYVQRLSSEARNEKADALLTFLLSRRAEALFEKLLNIGRDLEALGVAEERAHRLTFSRRAELVRGLVEVHGTFTETIAEIVGGGR